MSIAKIIDAMNTVHRNNNPDSHSWNEFSTVFRYQIQRVLVEWAYYLGKFGWKDFIIAVDRTKDLDIVSSEEAMKQVYTVLGISSIDQMKVLAAQA